MICRSYQNYDRANQSLQRAGLRPAAKLLR